MTAYEQLENLIGEEAASLIYDVIVDSEWDLHYNLRRIADAIEEDKVFWEEEWKQS